MHLQVKWLIEDAKVLDRILKRIAKTNSKGEMNDLEMAKDTQIEEIEQRVLKIRKVLG